MSSKRGFAKGRKRATDDYERDDFVIDDDDAPKSKKSKTTTKSKKAGASANGVLTDDNGDPYWELSTFRRVTVSEYKGKAMVSIREYYEKGGQMLPGKKGISLPMDQYTELLKALPAVESVLASKGEDVPRPNYDGNGGTAAAEQDEDDEEDDGIDGRKNFEATSDEDGK